MIKILREVEPQFLKDNKVQLWDDLSQAISQYGTYAKIPDDRKEKLIHKYRHKDVKDALIKSTEGKCAFCECIPSEGGNIEVEHFRPKSLYPSETFEWENLLPACRRCNSAKDDHDTGLNPIVNPYNEDPSDFFYYEGLNLKGRQGPLNDVAELTIQVCGLNTLRLWEPRSKIFISLHDFEASLKTSLENYEEAKTPIKKRNRLMSIREAIDRIEMLARRSEKYSGFCSHYLNKSSIYAEAKELVSKI
ncbi:retron system putative HNH endonuclease [Pseudomonas alvandae]|uniref:retron system putative HNH endonuclease n=1 Tax=Pseudomonas canavaninivorans TaxID=2842348 RepID=UPI002FF27198